MLLGSIYMNASDTLKVREVRFFVEPKATFIIPRYNHGSYTCLDLSVFAEIPTNEPNYYNDFYNWQNKSTINFGISGGISVRLSKHFNYELSLAYNYYNLRDKVTLNSTDFSGNEFFSRGTATYNNQLNAFFISNGLSYKYKRFIFTNSVMIGVISYTTLSCYNVDNGLVSSLDMLPYRLMSEHKIGYSLFKNRLEAYAGITILYNSPFEYALNHYWDANSYTCHNSLMPFTSVRVNF